MLKARVLTSFCLVPLALLIFFFIPLDAFALSLGLVLVVAGWEWIRLTGFILKGFNWIILLFFMGFIFCSYHLKVIYVPVFLVIGCGFWLGALWLVLNYPKSKEQLGDRWMKIGFGLFVLIPAYLALLDLRRDESHLLLLSLLMTIIWAADVGAYFVGKRYGRSRLAPSVSPGKSWAGLFGGLIAALAIGLSIAFIGEPEESKYTLTSWALFVVIVTVTVLFSVLGDLFESLMKRERGVKDSSALLPGHGGILDRIDSLTAAAPVFVLLVHWTGWPSI
jgi:phosphatidate cytidylyltransferase